MQDQEIKFQNPEELLARYLQLGPNNLKQLIELTTLAATSPIKSASATLPAREVIGNGQRVASIFQQAQELISKDMGESWRWFAVALLSAQFLAHLQQQLESFHADAKSAWGIDPRALIDLIKGSASKPSQPSEIGVSPHPACTEAAQTVHAHAERTLAELARRAELQVRARAEAYNADPSPMTAKLLLDAHSFPEILKNHGGHISRCLGCLRRLETIVEQLEQGKPALFTWVKF